MSTTCSNHPPVTRDDAKGYDDNRPRQDREPKARTAAVSWWQEPVPHARMYLTAMIVGGALAVLYMVAGSQIVESLKGVHILDALYKRSGAAAFALYPMAIVLAYQIVCDILHLAGVSDTPASANMYVFIIYAAPCAGFAGTILSLGLALGSMDLSSGTQSAFETFKFHASTAFDSTLDGIIIAPSSLLALLFLHREQPETEENQEEQEA